MIWIVLGVVAVLGVAWMVLWWLQRRGNDLVSVVILRSAPASVTEADVRGAYRRTFGDEAEIHTMELDATSRGYIAVSPSLPPLMVIVAGRPYMDAAEAEDVVALVEHPVARAALKEHAAWVSVDAKGMPRGTTAEQLAAVHTMLGRLAAEFIDERSLLLYMPKTGRVGEIKPETNAMLRDGRVGEAFGDDELQRSMILAEPGDQDIERAINQAREPLHECFTEFSRRGEASLAIVKARFESSDGGETGQEYIWLKLKRVNSSTVTATIENPPIDAGIGRKGDLITVPTSTIVDWMFIDESGAAQGGVLEAVLARKQG